MKLSDVFIRLKKPGNLGKRFGMLNHVILPKYSPICLFSWDTLEIAVGYVQKCYSHFSAMLFSVGLKETTPIKIH